MTYYAKSTLSGFLLIIECIPGRGSNRQFGIWSPTDPSLPLRLVSPLLVKVCHTHKFLRNCTMFFWGGFLLAIAPVKTNKRLLLVHQRESKKVVCRVSGKSTFPCFDVTKQRMRSRLPFLLYIKICSTWPENHNELVISRTLHLLLTTTLDNWEKGNFSGGLGCDKDFNQSQRGGGAGGVAVGGCAWNE